MGRRTNRSIGSSMPRVTGADPARDVDEELAFHLDMRTRELVEAGETPERARELALLRLGDMKAPRAECLAINERRRQRVARSDYLNELRQDAAYALRSLYRRPAFTAVAIITLALGIGANSAIFSVVYGVLLKPLPFLHADRLVIVETEYPDANAYDLSAPDFMSVARDNRVFDGAAALYTSTMTLTGHGDAREARRTLVSRGFFDLVGVEPLVGRTFTNEEHVPNAARPAVLTEAAARRLFGSPRAALNNAVTLSGTSYSIVGVMPAGTEAPEDAEIYAPLVYDSTFSASATASRRSEFLTVLGRLRPGMDAAAAERDMKRVGAALRAEFPGSNGNLTFRATSLSDTLVGSVRQPLFVLLGAVGLVCLIACANVANLLLARATTREGELAVRAALGAGRGRLVRQLLTEAVVLSTAGAAVGLLLAWWGTKLLVTSQPADIPRLGSIRINGTVVAFTAALSIATGLLFGALPAIQGTGARMMQSLREGGRGALGGVRGQRIRAAFVIGELALAVVLLTSAGLLIRSFVELTRVSAGFEPRNAITFRLSLQGTQYADAVVREQFFDALEERMRAIPGVAHVGGATGLPMTGSASLIGPFQAEGREVPEGVIGDIRVITVTNGYFDAVGAKLIRGRQLDERDRYESVSVAVVNRATITRWFPDGDPIGERVLLGGEPIEVVGVIEDMLQGPPNKPVQPEIYLPYSQRRGQSLGMVLRGNADMTAIAARVRAEVRAMNSQIPIDRVEPLEVVVRDALARPRFYTTLMVAFAAIAIALAVVGIFGVMNYLVAQRSQEISVRMALGADRARVIAMVVGSAMTVAGAGLALGFAGALAFTGVLRSQLFGVEPVDPITLIAVGTLLAGSAALASFLPARRASRLQPGAALRG